MENTVELPTETTPEVAAEQSAPKGKGKVWKEGTAYASNAYGKPLSSYKDKNGQKLPKRVKYNFRWQEWADTASLVEGHDELTLDEQFKVRAVEAKTTARQAANTALFDALGIVKPNEQTDSLIRLRKVYDGFYGKYRSQGMEHDDAHAKARAKAAENLEEEWPDEDEG